MWRPFDRFPLVHVTRAAQVTRAKSSPLVPERSFRGAFLQFLLVFLMSEESFRAPEMNQGFPHMRGGHYGPPYYLIVNNFFSQHVIDSSFWDFSLLSY